MSESAAPRGGRRLRRHQARRRYFGEKLANELTLDDLNAFMDVESGKTNRDRGMAVISTALAAAVKWRWIDYNLAKEVTRHKSKKRTRPVTDKEIAGATKKSGPRMSLAVELTRLTGMRQSAIIQLRWVQVHEDDRLILTRHYLTDKRIEVPITKEVQAVINKCKQLKAQNKSDFVIPTRTGEPYTSPGFRALWQRTINRWVRTGNDRFTFNDITMMALREKKQFSAQTPEQDFTVAGFAEFDAVVRAEATRMAQHHKVFYCLEKSIRSMITAAMTAAYGSDWRQTKVDPSIKQAADQIRAKEIDSGLPERSEAMLDYTTFGQLRLLISQNWTDVFSKKLKTEKMVGNVMTNLNRIRGPIAHFSPCQITRLSG